MKLYESTFLTLLRCGLRGVGVETDPGLSDEAWVELLRLARQQELLPLVYETVFRCRSFAQMDTETRRKYQDTALQSAVCQIVQSNEFLTLVQHAQARGLDPVVLKGIAVRSLYPRPMLRPSVDEDLLIAPGEAAAYHRFFLDEGLRPDDPEADPACASELSYHRPDSPTYIELHTSAFPPDSSAYADCGALFEGALERSVRVQIEDVSVRTLAPTDHLLFLLCHAYKHFLHGGIGIRQVSDLAVFAEKNGGGIDWTRVRSGCGSIRIEYFSAALFRIAQKHLGFELPEAFADLDADEGPLLTDILEGGNFGTADLDRMHSGNLTLDAVAAQKQGRRRSGLFAAAFPTAEYMAQRYPWLRGRRWLLPAAWLRRAGEYLLSRDSSAASVLRLGRERIKLLRQYRIID